MQRRKSMLLAQKGDGIDVISSIMFSVAFVCTSWQHRPTGANKVRKYEVRCSEGLLSSRRRTCPDTVVAIATTCGATRGRVSAMCTHRPRIRLRRDSKEPGMSRMVTSSAVGPASRSEVCRVSRATLQSSCSVLGLIIACMTCTVVSSCTVQLLHTNRNDLPFPMRYHAELLGLLTRLSK
jgi:hypothetical protein